MAEQINLGELIVELRADISDLTKKMDKAKDSINSVNDTTRKTVSSLQKLGRRFQKIGLIMAVIGGGIIFAMKKMIDAASEVSDSVGPAWAELTDDIKATLLELAIIVAEAVIPVFAMFWQEVLQPLIESFLNLDPGIRNAIIGFGAISGIFLIFGGIAVKVIGTILKFAPAFKIIGKAISKFGIGRIGILIGWIIAFMLVLGNARKALAGFAGLFSEIFFFIAEKALIAFGFIQDIVLGAINAIIRAINALGDLLGFSLEEIKGFNIHALRAGLETKRFETLSKIKTFGEGPELVPGLSIGEGLFGQQGVFGTEGPLRGGGRPNVETTINIEKINASDEEEANMIGGVIGDKFNASTGLT